MRNSIALLLWLLLVSAGGFAQFPTVAREIAFAQIAAGGGLETVVNVTNRGTTTYQGLLSLFRSSEQTAGQPWSPAISGSVVTDGKLSISLGPGETRTLRIIGSGSTETGFGTIRSSNSEETSFIEGTLTYYIKSGGQLMDSIGVLPSVQTYLTVIPFDSFSSLALALANAASTAATVQMKLYSSTNELLGTLVSPLLLQPSQQIPKYLWQYFPGVQMTGGGRVDIQSDVPIIGTALTDTGGQFSSLPMTPAVKAYNLKIDFPGLTIVASLNIRISGTVAEVRALSLTHNGQTVSGDPTYVTGTLIGNVLEIHIHTLDDLDKPIFECLTVNPFSFSASSLTGTIKLWNLDPPGNGGTGQFTMTAIN